MNRKGMVYFVSFAAFLGPFTQTIYTPILPEVESGFHTTPFLVNLSISIFTVGLALMQIVYGPLTDTKGRRSVLLFGVALYIAASIGCFLSPTIYWLLAFRLLQSVGIAAGSVVAATVIADLFEGTSRGRAMGTFQMMVSLGPVLGPVVGGFLGGAGDFHTVFLVLAATGSAVLLVNLFFLRETKPDTGSKEKFGWRRFAAVLADRTGAAVIALAFIQYYAFYNFLVFLPHLLGDDYGLDAQQKGMVFLPMSLSIVVGSFLGGKAQARWKGNRLLLTSSWLSVLAIVAFTLIAKLSLVLLIISLVAFGLFLGMSLPVQTTLLTHSFRHNRATAVGVYNFSRYMGMAAGPLLGTFVFHLGGYALLYGFVAMFFGCTLLYVGSRLAGRAVG